MAVLQLGRCARTDNLELQVPVERPPALPAGKGDVHRLARLNNKLQEPLYLFLVLVRVGAMHGHLRSC